MNIKPYPYISGYVRKFLIDHTDLGDTTVSTQPPPIPLIKPHVSISVTGQSGSTPRMRKVFVQITPWVPNDLEEDPVIVAWDIATVIGQTVSLAKNEVINSTTAWSAKWIEGPVELYDDTRGVDSRLFYTPVTFEVTISTKQ